ncbi:putative bifunctional diguanylate cyclase/phosphodiesterase [Rhodococcus pyridinivorans]|uniref:putative bifunctional diguanylate cyclase/phosphodiesterase n=1 Tax=Rhodococcus pyridinivorans TaxID=103816 RepID=UPI0022835F87|nr:bifunctional diguanylate cyclase/phosphodiesterase [Rhodococcus pyridinivorans]WAL47606.1 bifunctional diguanylate cyclase/phosphodiesterase [Rhodococcus pyridinivorans]
MPGTRRTLESLVTRIAARLMPADAASHVEVVRLVLRDLVEQLGVDTCFLRYNDHEIGATILVAEWPPRENVPDPDPIGVVYFRDADPVFAAVEHLKEPLLAGAGGTSYPAVESPDYTERVFAASGWSEVSMVAVPLVSGQVTTGVLGFVNEGGRPWTEDEVNALTLIAVLLAQVQARVRAEEDLRRAAYEDALTGLASRRALFEYLDKRLEPGAEGPVGLLFLDLDRLKALNDFLGHDAADSYLCRIADRLAKGSRPDDLVARLGGDEFVVVLDGPSTMEEAMERAEVYQDAVGASVALGNRTVGRGVSVGVALGTPGELSSANLLSRADQAMMVAKRHGGNGVGVFTEDMNEKGKRRTIIEMNLRSSIDDEHLTLEYQPEIDLRTGTILGVEALVRWNRSPLGVLQPGEFVEVAEATNLAGELGEWVVTRACAQLAEWKREIPDLRIIMSVNVSPVQLVSMDFDSTVRSVLHHHGLVGSELCLEITENVVVGDLQRTKDTLRRLERLGVWVAIDDFGTGYSSLGHLKALPVDTLKIDKGFVQNLEHSEEDRVIVDSIVGLASSFGLQVVAEGVETVGAVKQLLDLGCVRAQGFLLSRPTTPDRLRWMLQAGSVRLPWNTDTWAATKSVKGRLPH